MSVSIILQHQCHHLLNLERKAGVTLFKFKYGWNILLQEKNPDYPACGHYTHSHIWDIDIVLMHPGIQMWIILL